MRMKTIEVPEYVADQFNKPLGHPSNNPNTVSLSLERVYRLVYQALQGVDWPDWEINGRVYHSVNTNEPYGLECVDNKFYIYFEERGTRRPIAIFDSSHAAAKYFVWLVSDGKAKIDWSLFLDMEP